MTVPELKKEQLLEKANSLPMSPGVYIMKAKDGKVIYVGKSRKLKNRVSQYFQNSGKNEKTQQMVNRVDTFDYILCDTEMEALTLENTLIKQFTPKYNIRLKDAKSYPYIKVTGEEYPRLIMTRQRQGDKGHYYGPYSGVARVYAVINVLRKSFGLPNCNRQFPKEIGRGRPCIYYQMKQCCGLCIGQISKEEYLRRITLAEEVLKGRSTDAVRELKEKMMQASEEERYEAAAECRDAIRALEGLVEKQKVVGSPRDNQDYYALVAQDAFACLSVMRVRSGAVIEKADFPLAPDVLIDSETLSSFLISLYREKENIPPEIYISYPLEEADIEMISAYLSRLSDRKTKVRVPDRGEKKTMCDMVAENASEKIRQMCRETEKDDGVLVELAQLLQLEVVPERMEAYDISNYGSENKTGGMIVYEKGRFQKADYRLFKIRDVQDIDDYASMRETLRRRLKYLTEEDGLKTNHSLQTWPDLLLIDGGKTHVAAVKEVLEEYHLDIPVFGMAKDEYHKTRVLCTDREEISIAAEQGIFRLIYRIQEEVHRFTISSMRQAKGRTMQHSSLEKIPGIGPAKAKKILHGFSSLSAIKKASPEEMVQKANVSLRDAQTVYDYYHQNEDKEI